MPFIRRIWNNARLGVLGIQKQLKLPSCFLRNNIIVYRVAPCIDNTTVINGKKNLHINDKLSTCIIFCSKVFYFQSASSLTYWPLCILRIYTERRMCVCNKGDEGKRRFCYYIKVGNYDTEEFST